MELKQDNQMEVEPPILPSEGKGEPQEAPVAPPVLPKEEIPTSYPSFLREDNNNILDPVIAKSEEFTSLNEETQSSDVVQPILPPTQVIDANKTSIFVEEPREKLKEDNFSISVEDSASEVKEELDPIVEPNIPVSVVTEEQKVPEPIVPTPVVEKKERNEVEDQVGENIRDVTIKQVETDAQKAEQGDYKEVVEQGAKEKDSENENADYKSASFLGDLFANGNECITAPNGSFPVKDDTRMLLALFSNGRFFVSETSRFDGKVLGFEYLARKRHLQIANPEYVPQMVIGDIYNYVSRISAKSFVPPTVEANSQEQVRMQRDFVAIITKAASQKVSDIHIVVSDHTTVMFRINGLMQTEMEYNKDWGESFVRAAFASADISDANYAQNEYQAAQKLGRTPLRGSGGRLILPRNVLGIRLQFNPIAFGTRYVVMRLLYAEDDAKEASNLEALGFTKKETEIFYQLRAVPTGMVIISGPTGSGKSTTLQRNMISMLQERNYEINLITVEDPPEYPIPGARQMPVTNADAEDTKDREFTKALSAALRSDPDALMIGEIRALAAADLAFRGALSGHNVWTTLHANSASAILMRLKDIGVEDFKLQDPSLIRGLMAQRLFRKLCPECRIKALNRLDHPAVQRLRRAFGDIALEQTYLKGPGCEACDFRGVKGRTVVAEFVLPDATYLDLAIRGESKKAMNYWINDLNGITLRDAALSRMLSGIIDIEEVERWTGFLDQQIMA